MEQTAIKNEAQQTGIIFERIKKDRRFRQELARQSHYWFLQIYLARHLTHPLAIFHKQMLAITEDPSYKLVVMMAFRGSGKTTIMNTSYVLWAAIGKLQKKFILIISRSKRQAKFHLENIKYELEDNELMKNDLEIAINDREDIGPNYIVLKKLGVKIMAVGMQQVIRGLKYGPHRPDLIICDDLEDGQSVQKYKEVKQMCEWFKNEVLPCGDQSTNIVVLGNLLDESSFIMKLRNEITQDRMADAIFCAYPFLDDNDRPLWPERFTAEDIEKLKKSYSDQSVWLREHLLLARPRTLSYLPPHMYEKYFGQYLTEDEREKRQNNTGFLITAPSNDRMCGPNGEIITGDDWARITGETKKAFYQDFRERENRWTREPWPPLKDNDNEIK